MKNTMRVAIGQFREPSEERLTFAKQMGASGVLLNTPRIPSDKRWEFTDLLHLRARCEAYGLRLEAIENTPISFYDKAMLGLPGRDEQIENYQTTIQNMGEAGIPILGYHWMPNSVWRTSDTTPTRGGAHATSFDMDMVHSTPYHYTFGQAEVTMDPVEDAELTHGRIFTESEMWKNYEYFIKAILPVAEEADVKLALHPDDPPIEMLGGVARLMRNRVGFERALEIGSSPNHGLDFCMGCWSEMGPGVVDAIRYFGSRGKIFYVHFRDVQGTVPRFQECFLDEGNVDIVEAMRMLKEVGFDGFIIDDHVPAMIDDTPWRHRGRAFATGYIMGLLASVDSQIANLVTE